jgi:1-acyl-sn-glycerol-3-phosphate acyltransferase
LAQVALWVYFRKIYVRHRENFELKGPTIIVSNHPNTLIDPVIIAAYVKKPIFFLANAGLFKNPIAARILRFLYCIEVRRTEDTGLKKSDNSAAFEQSSIHLAAGGNIYIAIEGTSYMERVLRPLKTGFARIGFQALTGPAKEQEIYLLPIGLNYEKHDKSGYDLEIKVGASIPLSSYLGAYHRDEEAAIKDLTGEMRLILETLVIHTQDLEEEGLLLNIEAFFYGKIKKRSRTVFDDYRNILKHINMWEQKRSVTFTTWKTSFINFSTFIAGHNIALRLLSRIYFKTFPIKEKTMVATAGLPIYLGAWLIHVIPVWGSRWIKNMLNLYIGYTSTVKILSAIILAPLFYALSFIFIDQYVSPSSALLYLIFLPPSWWFLFYYERNVTSLNDFFRWYRLDEVQKKEIAHQYKKLLDLWTHEEEKMNNPL